MGELVKSFTFPRNALAKTPTEAAQKSLETIERVRTGSLRRSPRDNSIKDELFNDSRAFLGTVGGDVVSPQVLKVGLKYEDLYARDPSLAWDWLLTRSMWLWSLPNATQVKANQVARDLGLHVNFFDLVLRTLHHLEFQPGGSVLYFEELLPILDEDSNWEWSPLGVAPQIIDQRSARGTGTPSSPRPLLDALEPEYGIPRDNMAGVFGKAFGQSRIFQLTLNTGGQAVGICLSERTRSPGAQRSWFEFVLRHPKVPEGAR